MLVKLIFDLCKQNSVAACIPPSDPWSGKVIVSSDGTVANYSCAFGYSLSGLSERKCLPDGSGWEGEEPSCCELGFFYYVNKLVQYTAIKLTIFC